MSALPGRSARARSASSALYCAGGRSVTAGSGARFWRLCPPRSGTQLEGHTTRSREGGEGPERILQLDQPIPYPLKYFLFSTSCMRPLRFFCTVVATEPFSLIGRMHPISLRPGFAGLAPASCAMHLLSVIFTVQHTRTDAVSLSQRWEQKGDGSKGPEGAVRKVGAQSEGGGRRRKKRGGHSACTARRMASKHMYVWGAGYQGRVCMAVVGKQVGQQGHACKIGVGMPERWGWIDCWGGHRPSFGRDRQIVGAQEAQRMDG